MHVVNSEHGSKIDVIINNREKNKDELISKIYSALIASSMVNTDYLRQKWEQDLHVEIHTCSYNLGIN